MARGVSRREFMGVTAGTGLALSAAMAAPWVFDAKWSPQLIEDWDFKPTRQGAFFREKLRLLNK